MRRRTTAAAIAAVLLLAGCSSSDGSSADPEPTPSTSDAPVWNPCNGIEVGRVEDTLGSALTVERGTEDSPRCALVPAREGDAVIDANYTVFAGTFEEAWEAMGAPDDGSVDVVDPTIPTADGARLVVDTGTEAVGVTGFVQKGPLVLIVNALDTTPYRPGKVTAAVREVMTQLAAYAPE